MKKILPILALVVLHTSVVPGAQAQHTARWGVAGIVDPRHPLPVVREAKATGPATRQSRTLAPWTSLASLQQARGQHAAVAAANKIYVWGGYLNNVEINTLEIYDAATNTWSAGAAVPIVVRGHSYAAANGKLYSMGGFAGSGVVNTAYSYTPATNTWATVASMPTGQWEAAAVTAANGNIYVFGGETNGSLTQIYNPTTNTWSTGAPLPGPRLEHTAVLDASGLIHVIGGIDANAGAPTTSHLIYNPTTNAWTTGAALPIALNQTGSTLGADGNIYVSGGKANYTNNTGPFYSSVYVYNPTANTWTTGTSLPMALGETSAVSIGSNIYTIAGVNGTFQNVVYRSATVAVTYTWTGTTSTDWNVGSNWSGGVVPSAADDATIPTGLARYPVLTTTTPTVRTLTLNNGGQLTINDGGTLTVTGDLVNNGTFLAAGNASVNLTGAAAQNIGGSSITQFRNLTVGASGAVLAGQTEIQRLLTLTGNLSTNGKRFLILSNNVGTAMVNNSGGVVTGNAVVQRYIDVASNSGFGYRHFAPAVSGANLDNLTVFPILTGAQNPGPLQINPAYNSSATPGAVTPFPTIFSYEQSRVVAAGPGVASFDQGWKSPEVTNQPLVVGQGLTINEPAGNFFELAGTSLNTGNFSRTGLTRGTQSEAGWHLLGNPYPAPIDWTLLSRNNVDDAVYVYKSTGTYAGGYVSYVNNVGPASARFLPMAQAFFVRVSAAGASGTVGFTNAARLTTYTDPTYSRPVAETRPLLQLQLQRVGQSGAGSQDDFYVYEQNGATAGFDSGFDALKVQLNGGEQPTLYQQAGSDAVAIQGLPAGNMARSLALGIYAPVGGAYQFSPAQLINFATGEAVMLEDKLTGTWHDLRQGTYTCQLSQGLSASRFVLHLHQAKPTATGKAAAWGGELQLYPNPATNAPVTVVASGIQGATAELVLVNSVGQRVWQQAAVLQGRELRTAVPVAGLARGVYTLQVQSAAGVLTRKLVLQ